ncbi:conserved hypothetical Ustilaginaceae-specific protein [Sporisorium reilianum SRZ2]|uniref:Effector family protein Eff1 n=2 Tax=Sporisorium reilianum TaxID=72558 RepID=A0A2N8UBV9_9BASI|nr:conserved hypothetical Ustilaginaceae-specific protein [Sporisorium reilianum SRZ2]SJX62496.1 uncharacterized protein SRS1_13344 [Sporisorium reilianum f. sp. reilianum]
MMRPFRPTFLFVLVWISAFLVVAQVDRDLTDKERELYYGWNLEYQGRYYPRRYELQRLPALGHMLPAHPNLEAQALQHAHRDGYGPYVFQQGRRVSYAMTMIPGNHDVALNWNLRQNGVPPQDVNVFWRIDRNGPKMLRFDLWTAGARAQQRTSMSRIMALHSTRRRLPF